jgi:hypothetical protein
VWCVVLGSSGHVLRVGVAPLVDARRTAPSAGLSCAREAPVDWINDAISSGEQRLP